MLQRTPLVQLDDYFLPLGQRSTPGVYFVRLNGYNQQVHHFIQRYYTAARASGVILEGKLQNPDNNNLAYYGEIMGMEFQLNMGFLLTSLKKWLPRMNDSQRNNVAGAIYDTLMDLKKSGKTDMMLKNAYIKFMCWLYYKFERIVNHLGEETLPKILYDGSIGSYELLLMNVLSLAGCDILLLQYQGDSAYQRLDPQSKTSQDFTLPDFTPFPPGFSLKQLRQEMQEAAQRERLYGPKPQTANCTNAWISGKVLEDVRRDFPSRGSDPQFFYNCFCRITGVEDKLTYQNELYQLQLELKTTKRRLVILSGAIPPPTMEEIGGIRRRNYQDLNQLVLDLSSNLQYSASQELQRLMVRAFVDLLLEEGQREPGKLNRLTNRAVYLLCWLKRYQQQLFGQWKFPEIAAFLYLGGCKNENEALFCRFLARLPVDVLVFQPDRNASCCLEDRLLYTVNHPLSLTVSQYPEEDGDLRLATAAYQAERDLDSLMYQDSGLYRNQQYAKGNAVTLQTIYEEIAILWDQELKYRPNFATAQEVVTMPVIFSKVSGVKDGNVPAYWAGIKQLLTPDTHLISSVPHRSGTEPNPIRAFATEFFKNGRLQKGKLKAHKAYPYGFLREAMQDHLLDKLQLLIEQALIKGTFENGTEYTIVSTALNLDKSILRLVQKFDFTKKNPKLVYLIPGETVLSLEDTIQAAFLNLVGFDILFFVPTGYQCVERFFNRPVVEEHQIGDYLYDLPVPNFDTISSNPRPSWREKLFKRGT